MKRRVPDTRDGFAVVQIIEAAVRQVAGGSVCMIQPPPPDRPVLRIAMLALADELKDRRDEIEETIRRSELAGFGPCIVCTQEKDLTVRIPGQKVGVCVSCAAAAERRYGQ